MWHKAVLRKLRSICDAEKQKHYSPGLKCYELTGDRLQMKKRKEYFSRVPYRKKARRGWNLTRSDGRNKAIRMRLIGFPLALLAVLMIVLIVYGCLYLHDKAVEKKTQKQIQQAYAEQQGENVPNENEVPSGNGSSDGKGSEVNPPEGVSLVGTDSSPEPTTHPSVSPSPLPSSSPSNLLPTPEPTTNGHEFDDEMVIAIDAGHGGYDGGTVSGSVIEKDITLAVAQEIARLLEEHGGITVVQTRTSDVFVGKQERCDIANEAKCDYFVSVHCNSYESDSAVWGFECHYNEESGEGANFAQSVSNDMKQYSDMKIRSIKPNNLAVTRHTYCPAILIEMGFLTNPNDCANLSNSDYQKKIAERITKAVLKAAGL